MNLGGLGELALLDRVLSELPVEDEDIIIGPGDDCGLIRTNQEGTLITTDQMIEGVHFRWDLFTPYQVGYKLVVRNVSDIYAMGGRPRWALLSMALPGTMALEQLDNMVAGIKSACQRYSVVVVGGDIAGSDRTTLSMTMLGVAGSRLLRRSSARQGDRLFITGPVGEAALGLFLLKSIGRPVRLEEAERLNLELDWATVEPLLRRACLPELPEIELTGDLSACIDISDGLGIDLWRLCEASSVGARIYMDRIPLTEELKEVARAFGLDPWEFVFSGGEDYQLLLAGRHCHEATLYEIGQVQPQGCEVMGPDGRVQSLGPHRGYEHLRDTQWIDKTQEK